MSRTTRRSRYTESRTAISDYNRDVEYYWTFNCGQYRKAISLCSKDVCDKLSCDAKRHYDMFKRDGKYNESGKNQHFKWLTNKERRKNSKKMEFNALNDIEDESVDDGKMYGKKFIWRVW